MDLPSISLAFTTKRCFGASTSWLSGHDVLFRSNPSCKRFKKPEKRCRRSALCLLEEYKSRTSLPSSDRPTCQASSFEMFFYIFILLLRLYYIAFTYHIYTKINKYINIL